MAIVFFVTHAVGDPVRLLLPLEAPEAEREALRESLGLNDPVLQQFWRFLTDAFQGDFGESFWQGRPAMDVVLERVPATLLLVGTTFVVSIVYALTIGTIAGVRPGSVIDRLATTTSLVGVSLANFWLALMLILVFAVQVGWFPTSGYGSWQNLVLPVVALSALAGGRMTQVVRASIVDEMAKPYVLAARTRGMSTRRIVFRHALRNAGIPIVTLGGWELVRMLAGYTVPVEAVFSWPGLGFLAKQAVEQFDFPLILANVMLVAALVVFVNLVIDVLYAYLDPRIRLA